MKVLILGAGWFGCHCACTLLKHNIQFKIADISNDFFTGSSSKNQNRLHLGFHYPRSYQTRFECLKGFRKFNELYGDFVYYVPNNLYCVDKKSLLDFQTYIAIYTHEKTQFDHVTDMTLPFHINKDMFDGVLKVPEGYINFRTAQQYFRDLLGPYMVHNYKCDLLQTSPNIMYDGETYDYLIDCTYSAIQENMYYENCVSFIYKYLGDIPDFSITVMDGKFWSLYLYDLDKKLYTLTDVEHTPSGNENKRVDVELKVKSYIPDFDNHFEYHGFFISRKTKTLDACTDDRSLVWTQTDNIIRFSGGKITGIFAMEDILQSVLHLPQNQQDP